MAGNQSPLSSGAPEHGARRDSVMDQWHHAPVGLLLTDAEGVALAGNEAAARLLGTGQEGLTAMPLALLLPAEERENYQHMKRAALDHPGPQSRWMHLPQAGASSSPLAVRCEASASGEQLLWAFMETPAPAGEESLQQEIARLRCDMEHACSAKSQFLANMSHEIRTPMNAVVGMTRLLLEGALTDEQRDLLTDVDHAATALQRLLDNMLELSDIADGGLALVSESFSPGLLLQEAADAVAGDAARKGLALSLDIAPDMPLRLRADPGRLRQSLICLLDNAVKFTQAGAVSLRAGMETPQRFAVHVHDSGVGLDDTTLEDIFGAFVQADLTTTKRYSGVGVGLAICRQLVERMGGEITARNAESGGAVFTITLPVEHAPDGHELPPEATAEPRAALNILMAEDNDLNRRFTSKFLHMRGHSVTEATNGMEALEALGKQRFDLVLMDVSMPVMDGLEATKAIREHDGSRFDPRIPVVAVTAHALRGDEERFLDAGMDAYISKPLDLENFERVIQDVCQGFGACNTSVQPQPFDMEQQAKRFTAMADMLPELLALFAKNAQSSLEGLRLHLNQKHREEAFRAAHTMKGMAAVVCATGVEAAAAALEKSLVGDDARAHETLYAELRRQTALALAHLATAEKDKP